MASIGYRMGLMLLSGSLIAATAAVAQDERREGPRPERKGEGKTEKGKVGSYDDVITKEAKSDPGLFLVHRVGDSYGVRTIDDLLVGFKWIAKAIDEYGASEFVYGTEESHGYLRGPAVRDKDAAQAAVILCDRAAAAKARGRTLADDLDVIYRREGYYRELSKGMTFGGEGGAGRGVETMKALMASLRKDPPRDSGRGERGRKVPGRCLDGRAGSVVGFGSCRRDRCSCPETQGTKTRGAGADRHRASASAAAPAHSG